MLSCTGLSVKDYYAGVVHIHSMYSHDGHGTLAEMAAALQTDGIDFCIITDHFEDFDAGKFERYIADIEAVNQSQQTVFIPAIEAEFLGFHVIFLPVSKYKEIRSIVDQRHFGNNALLKILAHPSKHPLSEVVALLRDHRLDGIELWNQQADSSYLPPVRCFRELIEALPGDLPSVVFGSDVHNVLKHKVNNLLLMDRSEPLSPEFVVRRLRASHYINFNRKLGRHLNGKAQAAHVREWFDEVKGKAKKKAVAIQIVKRVLKFAYHLLPRATQHSINDIKNAIKNRL